MDFGANAVIINEIAAFSKVHPRIVELYLMKVSPINAAFAVSSVHDNVSPLIERFIDQNLSAVDDSALFNACEYGCESIVLEKMIQCGANVNAIIGGMTPITGALSSVCFTGMQRCLTNVKVLIENGGNINLIPATNCVPLGYASQYPFLLEALLDLGADPVPFLMGIVNVGKCFHSVTSHWNISLGDKERILDKFWNLYTVSLESKTPAELDAIARDLNGPSYGIEYLEYTGDSWDSFFEDIDLGTMHGELIAAVETHKNASTCREAGAGTRPTVNLMRCMSAP